MAEKIIQKITTADQKITTAEEWKTGRQAIEEYKQRLEANPGSCQLFEEIFLSFDNDQRVHKFDIIRLLIHSLNNIHTSHDDPLRHDYRRT